MPTIVVASPRFSVSVAGTSPGRPCHTVSFQPSVAPGQLPHFESDEPLGTMPRARFSARLPVVGAEDLQGLEGWQSKL